MGPMRMGRLRGRAERQHGQILVLFALMLVLLMGLAALVVDVGVLRRSSAMLAAGIDAGALAAGAQLPTVSGPTTDPHYYDTITASAVGYLNKNYPGLGATSSWISYRCLVEATSATPPAPNLTQIPKACQPGAPANTNASSTYWTCNAGRCTTKDVVDAATGAIVTPACNPATAGNSCNVVVVRGASTVGYTFGGALGIGSGSTGAVQSAACVGSCLGPPAAPMDVVIVIDRTTSMVTPDSTALKKAEDGARAMLLLMNPTTQYVGLGVLPPSSTSLRSANGGGVGNNACKAGAYSVAQQSQVGTWTPVTYPTLGLATDYQTNATTLNENSQLVNTIDCLNTANFTDQGSAVAAAAGVLNNHGSGRAGVKKVIVLLSDGRPQGGGNGSTDGAGNYMCSYANTQATLAKNAGIELYTIGFFEVDEHGAPVIDDCPDRSGSWDTNPAKTAVDLLASMSTQPAIGTTDCTAAENADEDHFYCLPKTGDLTGIFNNIVASFDTTPRLIALPAPQPVVTGVSPSSGKCNLANSVTISGQFFTDATGVSFGTQPADFTVNSDTSITAISIAGTPKSVVHITVTTTGGTSATVSADQYTYMTSGTSPLAPCG
jgi:hypothetical protein